MITAAWPRPPVRAYHRRSFNPLPVQRPGATPGSIRCKTQRHVSILSRYRDRELPVNGDRETIRAMFQSSPGTETGSYQSITGSLLKRQRFQSSPGTETGSYGLNADFGDSAEVSILSRYRDRELPLYRVRAIAETASVSILSRYRDRELHAHRRRAPAYLSFNPLPVQRPGATGRPLDIGMGDERFNPLPVQRPGATHFLQG